MPSRAALTAARKEGIRKAREKREGRSRKRRERSVFFSVFFLRLSHSLFFFFLLFLSFFFPTSRCAPDAGKGVFFFEESNNDVIKDTSRSESRAMEVREQAERRKNSGVVVGFGPLFSHLCTPPPPKRKQGASSPSSSSSAAAAAALAAQAAQVTIERRRRDVGRPLSLVAPAPQVR